MSYVARYLHHHGHTVVGADAVDRDVMQQLRALGMTMLVGHEAHIPADTDLVLASPAVLISNPPDIQEARERGIPVETWQQYLGHLTTRMKTIGVCGAHGKSTTTAMLGQAMARLELDPTVMVGTLVPSFSNSNLRLGDSSWLVLESDEYNENFLAYTPTYVLCTSFEPDHLDYFETVERYEQAFVDFFAKVPTEGAVFYHAEDTKLPRIIEKAGVCGIPVPAREIVLSIPGAHNRANATLVAAFLEHLGIAEADAEEALGHFHGTWRRQEKVGTTANGAIIFDDYAHHPTEIRATLAALREAYPDAEFTAVFQPHQFSRTRLFLQEFAEAFSDANHVYIMDIYESRDTEEDKKSVSSQDLVALIAAQSIDARASGDVDATLAHLQKMPPSEKQQIIVCMGAGSVTSVARSLSSESAGASSPTA